MYQFLRVEHGWYVLWVCARSVVRIDTPEEEKCIYTGVVEKSIERLRQKYDIRRERVVVAIFVFRYERLNTQSESLVTEL